MQRFRVFFLTITVLSLTFGSLFPSQIDAGRRGRRFVADPAGIDKSPTAQASASIMLIDPPIATVHVPAITVRGLDWGPYNERLYPEAWLVDPDDNTLHKLSVNRNYDDCTFAISVKGECSDDQLFLRLEIPADVKTKLTEKIYGLYVSTEHQVSAMGQFMIVDNPLPEGITKPTLALVPAKGPVGTHTLLFGAGFPPKEGLRVRFDGTSIQVGGHFASDERGAFENIGISIPRTIMKDNKPITISPGEHEITVINDDLIHPVIASAPFTVQEKVEFEKKKDKKELEQIEKDRKLQEQIDKEQKKIEQEKKRLEEEKEKFEKEKAELAKKIEEQKKKEQEAKDKKKKEKIKRDEELLKKKLDEKEKQRKEREKKLVNIDKKQDSLDTKEENIKTWFCDPILPITFQPGCVQLKKELVKNPYEGRPCSADMPITFQSGCIAQQPEAQKKLFMGKACSDDIPLVWQEGCIPQPRPEIKSEYEGKPCDPLKAITFQPGCIPPKPKEPEVQSFQGQKCNPLIPHYTQVGCIE